MHASHYGSHGTAFIRCGRSYCIPYDLLFLFVPSVRHRAAQAAGLDGFLNSASVSLTFLAPDNAAWQAILAKQPNLLADV
jgi:hypothetical protein